MVNNKWKIAKSHSGNPAMKEKDDQLFDVMNDSSEKKDEKNLYLTVYEHLLETASEYGAIKSEILAPPYEKGRKRFKAPKNWLIEK